MLQRRQHRCVGPAQPDAGEVSGGGFLSWGSLGQKSPLPPFLLETGHLLCFVGKSPLEINSLQLFTGGLKVKLNKRHIKPHETAMLKITAEAKVLRNARTKPRVLMITNAPVAPKLVIPLNVK